MKNFLRIAIVLLALIIFASCTPSQTIQSQPEPPERPHPSLPEPRQFASKEEFYHAVIGSQISAFGINEEEYGNLGEIMQYIDFVNPVDEIELIGINVRPVYVSLEYQRKNENQHGTVSVVWHREADSEGWLEMARTRLTTNPVDIYHNGKTIVKNIGYIDGIYIGNQYYFALDDFCVSLKIPSWLLELYPEETFFDVHAVTVDLSELHDTQATITIPDLSYSNGMITFNTIEISAGNVSGNSVFLEVLSYSGAGANPAAVSQTVNRNANGLFVYSPVPASMHINTTGDTRWSMFTKTIHGRNCWRGISFIRCCLISIKQFLNSKAAVPRASTESLPCMKDGAKRRGVIYRSLHISVENAHDNHHT
jgi:hypothetical protein